MLRQLVIGKKLEETNEQLRALTEAWTALTERRAELQKREAELEEAIKEVNAETPDEDKKIVEDKTAEWEKDDAALTGEETENQQARAAIEEKIADLTAELDELNARSAAKIATPEPEKRKEGTVVTMETRKFFGMNLQERDAFMARQDVKDFLERVRRFQIGHGAADDVTARVSQRADLGERRLRIAGVGVRHGLHRDGRAAADRHRADHDLSCFHRCYRLDDSNIVKRTAP